MSTVFKPAVGEAAKPRAHAHFIDGRDSPSEGGTEIERRNPATGDVVATWPAGSAEDVDRAVAAAVAGVFRIRRLGGGRP